MEYKSHDYQQFAINYILEHPIAAVILGMGLGKTSITLTAIEQLIYDSFEVSKVLVVAPLRVARNTWSDEIHKWNHLKHLRYSIVLGSAAERKRALEADADIYIINRENLQWLIEQSGVKFFWDMVVLDELSSFKNWNCKRFKAFMKVRPNVKRVIGLTGTPSSNGLMDLFAEFKCLDMGERLGRFISQYRVNYFVPDRMNGPIVYSYKLRNGAEEQIYEKISDITISMKALDHLQMPELISNEYPVYMDADEAKIYADMEEDLFIPLKKGEITAANAAALSGKLLQMANGAVYSDDGDEIVIHDQKLGIVGGENLFGLALIQLLLGDVVGMLRGHIIALFDQRLTAVAKGRHQRAAGIIEHDRLGHIGFARVNHAHRHRNGAGCGEAGRLNRQGKIDIVVRHGGQRKQQCQQQKQRCKHCADSSFGFMGKKHARPPFLIRGHPAWNGMIANFIVLYSLRSVKQTAAFPAISAEFLQ